jgi:hypothetical protein
MLAVSTTGNCATNGCGLVRLTDARAAEAEAEAPASADVGLGPEGSAAGGETAEVGGWDEALAGTGVSGDAPA